MPSGVASTKKKGSSPPGAASEAAPETARTQGPTGAERGLAALAYWGPLVMVPLFIRKKGRFLSYHTRQGIYLFGSAVATVFLTIGLLFVFDQTTGRTSPPFLILSVILLLEVLFYGFVVLVLTIASLRARMPMLPLLGDLAGES